jgi:hypothetical protein
MRGPDSKAGRNCGNSEPGPPDMGARPAHVVEQANSRIRGQGAYNGCQAYEPQVMLSENAIEYSVHVIPVATQNGFLQEAFQSTHE